MKIIMDIVEYRNVSARCHMAALRGALLVFQSFAGSLSGWRQRCDEAYSRRDRLYHRTPCEHSTQKV